MSLTRAIDAFLRKSRCLSRGHIERYVRSYEDLADLQEVASIVSVIVTLLSWRD